MVAYDMGKRALDKRLESIAWGLFLIMLGGLWLIPEERVPEGMWLIGVGLIMLGLNLARYLNGIRASGFTIVLGILALGSGISDVAGIDLPVLPILIILVGANILYKALMRKE